MRIGLFVEIVALAALAGACSDTGSEFTTSASSSTGMASSSGAGGAAGAGAGGSSTASSSASSGAAGGTGGVGGMAACPTSDTPMVEVQAPLGNTYCVDATEVTNARYAAWLATMPPTASQPPECAWNTQFEPSSEWPAPAAKTNHPVVFVDWCDAHSYCIAMGKRLCGSIDGGSNDYTKPADPSLSQWFNACSYGGMKTFAYGQSYDPMACNGVDLGIGDTVAVGSLPGCEGGFPGVFDMTGNVWEWEDSCGAATGDTDSCRQRGGAHYSDETSMRCSVGGDSGVRSDQQNDIGFRCCAK